MSIVNDTERMIELYTEKLEGKIHQTRGGKGKWADRNDTYPNFSCYVEYRVKPLTQDEAFEEAVAKAVARKSTAYGRDLFDLGVEYGKLISKES